MVSAGQERAKPRIGLGAGEAEGAETVAVIGAFEGDGLVPTGRHPRELERDLDRVRPAGCEQHLGGRAGPAGEQFFREKHRRLIGEAARRERQRVELRLERGDEARMAIAQMMRRIAVKIDEAPPFHVFEPYALRAFERKWAGRRALLMEEAGGVAGDEVVGHEKAFSPAGVWRPSPGMRQARLAPGG